jgi:hypothetical protein
VPELVEYRPRFAPHVRGSYTPRARDPETQELEPQEVRATCEKCGEAYGPVECKAGRVRQRVDLWASQHHLHRDPMTPRPVAKLPGS